MTCSDQGIPRLPNGRARKDLKKGNNQVEKEVHPDQAMASPEQGATLPVRNKDTQNLKKNNEFYQEDNTAIYDPCEAYVLYIVER